MPTMEGKYRGTREYFLVHRELVNAAQYRGTVTYTEVARILGISQAGHHMARQVGEVLGEISEDELRCGRPMLSALAVGATGEISDGFYQWAVTLGALQDASQQGKERFLSSTRKDLYETWREDWRKSLA